MDLLKFYYSKIGLIFNVFEFGFPWSIKEVPIWTYEGSTLIVDNYLICEDDTLFWCEDGVELKVE